jgi:hypothetical protein
MGVFAVLAAFKVAYLIFSLVTLWRHPDQITVSVTYSQYALVGNHTNWACGRCAKMLR